MTNPEKLTQLKAMLGNQIDENWSDEVLLAYLLIAGRKIINRAYPYSNDDSLVVPTKYEMLQCEIAIYLLNKRGAEGETSHSENGISRSYESADVPESMLKEIVPFCSVI